MEILDIMTLDEKKKSVTLSLNSMLVWKDDRYYITGPDPENVPGLLKIPLAQYDQVERPDMMFLNSFALEKLPLVGANEFRYFWFYGYRFEYAEYLKLDLGCHFDFSSFPFDYHECDLRYYSPSYDAPMLSFEIPTLNQDEGYVDLRIPFQVNVEVIEDQNKTLKMMTYEYNTAGVRLSFQRNEHGILISGFFVPTGTFAIFSILSLLLGQDKVNFDYNN